MKNTRAITEEEKNRKNEELNKKSLEVLNFSLLGFKDAVPLPALKCRGLTKLRLQLKHCVSLMTHSTRKYCKPTKPHSLKASLLFLISAESSVLLLLCHVIYDVRLTLPALTS